jgi:hypothetical protein
VNSEILLSAKKLMTFQANVSPPSSGYEEGSAAFI